MGTPGTHDALLTKVERDIVAGPGAVTDWQQELRRALRSSAAVREAVGLPPSTEPDTVFPVLAPWPLLRRIRQGDPRDPVLLQILSRAEELQAAPGELSDPLQEAHYAPVPGLIRKYHSRALLVTTGACAVHCRYCFRREFPYAEHAAGRLHEAVAHLAHSPEIREVILSGGDPLTLDDDRLGALLDQLDALPHVQTVRLHTRLPVVIPTRVTAELILRLQRLRARVVIVIHVNHAQELDTSTHAALAALRPVATLLNQSVLLRGVNDDLAALIQLSEGLFASGVLPYYLHQLDPVRGSAHFSVSDRRARHLQRHMRAQLPGYLVPRLVREVPGAAHKMPL